MPKGWRKNPTAVSPHDTSLPFPPAGQNRKAELRVKALEKRACPEARGKGKELLAETNSHELGPSGPER